MGGGCAYPHPPAIREMRRLPNRMVPSDDALYMFREIVPRESGGILCAYAAGRTVSRLHAPRPAASSRRLRKYTAQLTPKHARFTT